MFVTNLICERVKRDLVRKIPIYAGLFSPRIRDEHQLRSFLYTAGENILALLYTPVSQMSNVYISYNHRR